MLVTLFMNIGDVSNFIYDIYYFLYKVLLYRLLCTLYVEPIGIYDYSY
jgi:hypothetical protein